MNLVLLETAELPHPLAPDDPRVRHVRGVLRRAPGEPFDAGLVDGPMGTATLEYTDVGVRVRFTPVREPPALPPITLLIGMCRPQTARDVLRDATTMGVRAIHVVVTQRSEPGYAQSSLWSSGEWRRHLLTGAAQAFDTRLPEVQAGRTLTETLAALPDDAARLALDNYEAEAPLGARAGPVVLALGPERGWGPTDRDALRAHGFRLAHLGSRVLRLESACVAGLAVLGRGQGAG